MITKITTNNKHNVIFKNFVQKFGSAKMLNVKLKLYLLNNNKIAFFRWGKSSPSPLRRPFVNVEEIGVVLRSNTVVTHIYANLYNQQFHYITNNNNTNNYKNNRKRNKAKANHSLKKLNNLFFE